MSKRLCGWPHGQNIRKPCGFQRSQSLSLISSWDDHQLTFIFFSLKPPGPSGHENVPATVGQWLKFAFRSQASGAVGNGTRIIISFPIKTLRSQLYSTLGYTAGRCWLNYHELSISGQTQTVSSRCGQPGSKYSGSFRPDSRCGNEFLAERVLQSLLTLRIYRSQSYPMLDL